MRLLGHAKSIAIAVNDGLTWRAYALRQARGEWDCVGRTEEAARGGRQLPKGIIEFLAQSRARRLRVLQSGDVHTLSTVLPEDASEEELHTALAYEAQGEIGLEAAGHRLVAARADLYKMGGERKSLLAAGFEIERLERLAADAEGEAVAFEGAGSLELAVLAAHARRAPNRRLLLIRKHTSFYAVPANDPQPFMTAMLPLGIDMLADSTARERAERARERLSAHDAMPLSVILPVEAGRSREQFMPYLGASTDIEFPELSEIEEAAVRQCAGGRVGGVDEACPWIGLPPPPSDPHRHGTVILFAILAATLVWVGWRKQNLESDLRAAKTNRTAWESLENARKRAESATKSLRDRQNALLAKKTLLEQRRCLPLGLLPLLGTLAEHMPAYSYLQSVKQRDGGGFEIAGITRWQDGLPQLDAALRDMGEREGLRREFGGLQAMEEQYAQRFQFVVMPKGGQP